MQLKWHAPSSVKFLSFEMQISILTLAFQMTNLATSWHLAQTVGCMRNLAIAIGFEMTRKWQVLDCRMRLWRRRRKGATMIIWMPRLKQIWELVLSVFDWFFSRYRIMFQSPWGILPCCCPFALGLFENMAIDSYYPIKNWKRVIFRFIALTPKCLKSDENTR